MVTYPEEEAIRREMMKRKMLGMPDLTGFETPLPMAPNTPWSPFRDLATQRDAMAMNVRGGVDMKGVQPKVQQFASTLSDAFPNIPITSGYRSPAHNRAVRGASGSQHLHGNAMDVSLRGMSEQQKVAVYNFARSQGATGIGYYPNSDSAHFDFAPGGKRAWGPNYSRSSLPQTPQWYQKVAAEHFGSAPLPANASRPQADVASGLPSPPPQPTPKGMVAAAVKAMAPTPAAASISALPKPPAAAPQPTNPAPAPRATRAAAPQRPPAQPEMRWQGPLGEGDQGRWEPVGTAPSGGGIGGLLGSLFSPKPAPAPAPASAPAPAPNLAPIPLPRPRPIEADMMPQPDFPNMDLRPGGVPDNATFPSPPPQPFKFTPQTLARQLLQPFTPPPQEPIGPTPPPMEPDLPAAEQPWWGTPLSMSPKAPEQMPNLAPIPLPVPRPPMPPPMPPQMQMPQMPPWWGQLSPGLNPFGFLGG